MVSKDNSVFLDIISSRSFYYRALTWSWNATNLWLFWLAFCTMNLTERDFFALSILMRVLHFTHSPHITLNWFTLSWQFIQLSLFDYISYRHYIPFNHFIAINFVIHITWKISYIINLDIDKYVMEAYLGTLKLTRLRLSCTNLPYLFSHSTALHK